MTCGAAAAAGWAAASCSAAVGGTCRACWGGHGSSICNSCQWLPGRPLLLLPRHSQAAAEELLHLCLRLTVQHCRAGQSKDSRCVRAAGMSDSQQARQDNKAQSWSAIQ